MKLSAFYRLLEKHDWYFEFSDDHRVWTDGQSELESIERYAKTSDKHMKLYEDYKRHMFTGKLWGNEQAPKPMCPVDGQEKI